MKWAAAEAYLAALDTDARATLLGILTSPSEVHAVSGHLHSAFGEECQWRHAVPRHEPVHVRRRGVPGGPCIHHGDRPARPPEHECSTQAGRPTSDDHHVVRAFPHA